MTKESSKSAKSKSTQKVKKSSSRSSSSTSSGAAHYHCKNIPEFVYFDKEECLFCKKKISMDSYVVVNNHQVFCNVDCRIKNTEKLLREQRREHSKLWNEKWQVEQDLKALQQELSEVEEKHVKRVGSLRNQIKELKRQLKESKTGAERFNLLDL